MQHPVYDLSAVCSREIGGHRWVFHIAFSSTLAGHRKVATQETLKSKSPLAEAFDWLLSPALARVD